MSVEILFMGMFSISKLCMTNILELAILKDCVFIRNIRTLLCTYSKLYYYHSVEGIISLTVRCFYNYMVHFCLIFTISKTCNLIKIKVKHPQTQITLANRKLKIGQHESYHKPGLNACTPDELAVSCYCTTSDIRCVTLVTKTVISHERRTEKCLRQMKHSRGHL